MRSADRLGRTTDRIKRLKSLASQSSKTCTVRDSLPLLRTGDTVCALINNFLLHGFYHEEYYV
ncbi:hypothetical protein YC2023_115550 [Brassica napus]